MKSPGLSSMDFLGDYIWYRGGGGGLFIVSSNYGVISIRRAGSLTDKLENCTIGYLLRLRRIFRKSSRTVKSETSQLKAFLRNWKLYS